MFFSILKFWFSRLSGGWKGKKWPKMTKISVCRTLYFRNHVSYDLHLWYTCMHKRIISPGIFHFFSKFWFSRLLGRGGSWKMAQNDKKFCFTPCQRNCTTRLLPKHFCLQLFFLKDSVSLMLAQLSGCGLALWKILKGKCLKFRSADC